MFPAIKAILLFMAIASDGDVLAAQVKCTMPNGVVITQQLSSCPKDAIKAESLDGTPVKPTPLAIAQPTATRRTTEADPQSSSSVAIWATFALIACGIWRWSRKRTKRPTHRGNLKPQTSSSGEFLEGPHAIATPLTVHVVYKDESGNKTKRTVHVQRFGSYAEGVITGHCSLRNTTRSFRYDRIERAIDPSSGEVIKDLPTWLSEKFSHTQDGKASALIDKNVDLLKLFLYAAKADGAMRAAEIQAITQALTEITGDPAIDIATTKQALSWLETPTPQGFKLTLRKLLTEDPAKAVKAQAAIKIIVNTKKTTHPTEQAILDYFEKVMQSEAKKQGNQSFKCTQDL